MADLASSPSPDRARSARRPPWSALVWHLAGAITILLVPSQLRLGLPFWALPPEQTAQVLGMVWAYLALAFVVSFVTGAWARLIASALGGLVCFGAAYGVLTLNPDVAAARLMVVMATAMGVLLVWVEPMVRGRQLLASGALATIVLALTLGFSLTRDPGELREGEWPIGTATQTLVARAQHGLVGRPESDGGAIAALGDGYLIMTGDGKFYRLRRDAVADTLVADPLATTPPLNRQEYLASLSDDDRVRRLRTTDLLVDSTSNPPRALASHQYWNLEEACFTLRVSAVPLDSLLSGTGMWETLYESSPCIPSSEIREDIQTGGRLAIDTEGRLLVTVGDLGHDGLWGPNYPQELDADYGKILAIGPDGGRQLVSRGHRNPQGLMVDRQGRIWSTEHGPKGGDEINLVRDGGNYGWPHVTYGTSYGAAYWLGGPGLRDHGQYVEPVYAFVPSIGINQIIEIESDAFPGWEGDLLIASLQQQSLWRVRVKDERVRFVERIRVDGYRVRDLEHGADGHIVLLTDEGDVLSLRTSDGSTGETLFASMCADCHRAGTYAGAPGLRGVVGRPVASVDWQGYSPALQRLGGSWTEERLDAFLRDPGAVAPGTRMQFPGIADADQRQLIIDYLATLE